MGNEVVALRVDDLDGFTVSSHHAHPSGPGPTGDLGLSLSVLSDPEDTWVVTRVGQTRGTTPDRSAPLPCFGLQSSSCDMANPQQKVACWELVLQ